jgi:hypothetical protein
VISKLLVGLLVASSPAAPVGDGRLGIIVVATVPQLESEAGQLQGALEDDLGRNRVIARWGELVGADATATAAASKVRLLVDNSFKACSAPVSPGEGSRADEAVATLAMAAPAVTPQDVQKAYAAVSATRWTANQPAEAEHAANTALAIDPGLSSPQVMIPPGFDELWERSRFSAKDRARTSLDISSDPPGARILVDGTPKGFTPTTIEGLTVGAHLVQGERVGYSLAGSVAVLTGAGASLALHLIQAPGFRPLDVIGAAQQAQRGSGGAGAQVAARYGLSYVIIGVLSPKPNGASTLLLSAFTSASPKPLGIQVVTFEGDEYGTAGKTASTAASTLLEGKVQSAKSDDTTKAHGGDPLDHRDGTEEW